MKSLPLPPGPSLPALVQTAQFYSGRHTAFPRLREKYGDTFSMKVYPGPDTYVMFSRPEDIKQIFGGDIYEFSGAAGNEVLRAAMGDRSVMLNDGDAHRAIRKYLMPAFSPRAIRTYQPQVQRIAANQVSTWEPGQQVLTLDEMSSITLEVMLELVFGLTEGERITELRPRLLRLVEVNPLLALGWMYPKQLTKLPPWRGPQKNLEAIDELLYAEIRQRQTTGQRGTDMLSQLLDVEPALPQEEIRDQLITLVLAGYETSASALSWTLHELARNPEVQDRAAQDAIQGEDDYLEACLKEGMRRHPIIDFVVRQLKSPQKIGDWDLPAGVFVVPGISLVHGDDAQFSAPDEFQPERFLQEGPAPNTWVPFGGGVRRCVGSAFALMEGVVTLREVLSRFRLHAEGEAPNKLRNITNVPSNSAPVTLSPR